MSEQRTPYWARFAAFAAGSLGLLLLFVFGFLPQRFLLELDFNESGYAFPALLPGLPILPIPVPDIVTRPTPRGPAERFWATYLPLAEGGEYEAAAEVLHAYLKAYPADGAARLESARTLWRLRRFEEADAAYARALELDADLDVKLERARMYVDWGRLDEAIALFEELAAITPDDRDLLSELAQLAVSTERYDLALDLYARLSDLSPRNPEPRFRIAQILYWTAQLESAAKALDSLPEGFAGEDVDSLRASIAAALPPAAPELAAYDLERARSFALEGAVDSALAIYRHHLTLGSYPDTLLLELADVFDYRAELPDSAMAYLRLYLSRVPEAAQVRLRLARSLAWSGQLEAAEVEARRLLRDDPPSAEAWALLGDLYRWRAAFGDAERAYRRALALDPTLTEAAEGAAALRAQVDATLASRGTAGPGGGIAYFGDSDDFALATWAAEYRFGSPRSRAALAVQVENVSGRDLSGSADDLTALEIAADVERWYIHGDLHVSASLGAWIPDSGAGPEPTARLAITAPELGGSLLGIEYSHGPAFRQTVTLEAALAGLRFDALALNGYRALGERWDLSAKAGLTHFSGAGDANIRADIGAGVFFRPSGGWMLGLETQSLTFAEAAPNPGRRLYWDPQWYWANVAVVGWSGAPAVGWNLELVASPGVAWVNERGDDGSFAALLGARADVERRWGPWALLGRAGFGQSRTDGYRSFRFELGLTRSFNR